MQKQLIDNYKILDFQSFVLAVNEMQHGAYDKTRSTLLAINQNIEFQSQGSSLYFIIKNPSEEEAWHYIKRTDMLAHEAAGRGMNWR